MPFNKYSTLLVDVCFLVSYLEGGSGNLFSLSIIVLNSTLPGKTDGLYSSPDILGIGDNF
jgi:hypothetical protein